MGRQAVAVLGMLFLAHTAAAEFIQQGRKLVGTGAIGTAAHGCSVAISADGNTAIVGGSGDNSGIGAAWVYTRGGGVWSQQGRKLTGIDAADPNNHILQGTPVAISADGNTAIVSGDQDHSDVGAAWVFMASGCATPLVMVEPQGQTIATGQTATLSVIASGGAALSYQWYQGPSGDTPNPVGTNASSFTTPALTAPASYWVRVSNSCGQVDSTKAIVSIISCTPPSITVQPQSRSLQSGQTTTLSVTASGSAPLSYQWYQGVSGDTTRPVGTDASSFTTPALTAPASYWVRVSNSCGHADSATATVTVGNRLRRHLRRVA